MTRVERPSLEAILGFQEGRLRREEQGVADPALWVYVGSGSPAPAFQNGFSNVGGARVPMRYRFLRHYDPEAYESGIEIQGSVTGGGPGLAIFTMLVPGQFPDGTPNWLAATRDFDLHLPATDDAGGYVPFTVLQSGDVVFGFV